MNELRELEEEEDIPGWVRGMMSPLKANLEAVTIEYGLFGGRFWLPRTQYAVANAQASFMRIPVRIEESFTYNSVNGPEAIPALPPPPKSIWDSLFAGDTTPRRNLSPEERRARNRQVARVAGEMAERRAQLREQECAATGSYTRDWDRYEGTLRMAVKQPCDSTKLATNQVTHLFTETGWAMLQMCPVSRVYTINVCPSGATTLPDTLTCPS